MAEKTNRAQAFGQNCYIDTRGACTEAVTFTQAVVDGLAAGGGLYVPETIPHFELEEIVALADLSYAKRAAKVYRAFNIDLDDETIDTLMDRAYGTNFDDPAICPITPLENDTYILELWHGPTSAFKDMALQCLPHFFSASAKHLRDLGKLDHEFCILVATSGDTGKAALEGFKGVDGVCIGVLFPDGGVSDIQRKQMVTTTGDNVSVWAVRGNFDDCQTGVKRVFSDAAFEEKLLSDYRIALSSANSINWGRLLPQVVYYLSAYAELVKANAICAGDEIDVCVPTGNFGNILAAWYARQIGAPIHTLVCASNQNRVLTDFITTGTYDISDREFILTPSPSMDILVSSNLERQLFELSGRNGDAIASWMNDLNEKRSFTVDDATIDAMHEVFAAGSADNATCLSTIKDVFETQNYLLDPHTAVAYAVAQSLRSNRPMIVASTAHWAKFGDNVYRALHGIPAGEPLPSAVAALSGCELNELIAQETGDYHIPAGLAALDNMDIRFSDVIDRTIESIEAATEAFLQR